METARVTDIKQPGIDPISQIILDELRATRREVNDRLDGLVTQQAFEAEQRRIDERHENHIRIEAQARMEADAANARKIETVETTAKTLIEEAESRAKAGIEAAKEESKKALEEESARRARLASLGKWAFGSLVGVAALAVSIISLVTR